MAASWSRAPLIQPVRRGRGSCPFSMVGSKVVVGLGRVEGRPVHTRRAELQVELQVLVADRLEVAGENLSNP